MSESFSQSVCILFVPRGTNICHTQEGVTNNFTHRGGGPTLFTKGGINIFHQMGGGISIFTEGRYISKLKVGTNIFAQGTRNIMIHYHSIGADALIFALQWRPLQMAVNC